MDKDRGLAHLRELAGRLEVQKAALDALYDERRRWFIMLRGVATNVEIAEAAGITDVMVIKDRNREERR